MPQATDEELKALKDQFEELIRSESASEADLQTLCDAQIRLRFGEMISRATMGKSKYGY